jgi:hypothetical protein
MRRLQWWLWVFSLRLERHWICMRIEWLRIVAESDPLWAHPRVLKLDRDGRILMKKWNGEWRT